ncbi:MAG: hypothetical protein ABEJ61_05430 [Haloferacaceae archaeon]
MCHTGVLSCTGKLARVVLSNRGPLSPTELAEEAHISPGEAEEALEELKAEGFAQSVCGLCASQEEVYELTGAGEEFEDAAPS